MNIQCVKATTAVCGSERETIADLLLADYGLVIRGVRFLSDSADHMAAVILPREQLIEQGKPVTREVLQFTSEWDVMAFVSLATKAILIYQTGSQVPR
jgi:hypothetical protein